LHRSFALAMAPKRGRPAVSRVSREELLRVIVERSPGPLCVGEFGTKDAGGRDALATLLVWAEALEDVIGLSETAVVLWSELSPSGKMHRSWREVHLSLEK